MAFIRWVFPQPEGPYMNMGLNWVDFGCSAIDNPTERGSLLLSPSM